MLSIRALAMAVTSSNGGDSDEMDPANCRRPQASTVAPGRSLSRWTVLGVVREPNPQGGEFGAAIMPDESSLRAGGLLWANEVEDDAAVRRAKTSARNARERDDLDMAASVPWGNDDGTSGGRAVSEGRNASTPAEQSTAPAVVRHRKSRPRRLPGQTEFAAGGVLLRNEVAEMNLSVRVKVPARASGEEVPASGQQEGALGRRPLHRGHQSKSAHGDRAAPSARISTTASSVRDSAATAPRAARVHPAAQRGFLADLTQRLTRRCLARSTGEPRDDRRVTL